MMKAIEVWVDTKKVAEDVLADVQNSRTGHMACPARAASTKTRNPRLPSPTLGAWMVGRRVVVMYLPWCRAMLTMRHRLPNRRRRPLRRLCPRWHGTPWKTLMLFLGAPALGASSSVRCWISRMDAWMCIDV